MIKYEDLPEIFDKNEIETIIEKNTSNDNYA